MGKRPKRICIGPRAISFQPEKIHWEAVMNILFFLTPKASLTYVYDDYTVRQALEKMERYKYAAVPILNKDGKYMGTLTEGDLLWTIKEQYQLSIKEAENIPIKSISRRMDNVPVYADTNIEDLIVTAMNQNFVPVIDDRECFIGMITRKDIIRYCYDQIELKQDKAPSRHARVSNLA